MQRIDVEQKIKVEIIPALHKKSAVNSEYRVCKAIVELDLKRVVFIILPPVYADSMRECFEVFLASVSMCAFVQSLASSMNIKQTNKIEGSTP